MTSEGGALEGLRVLELGSLLAGPLCARILSDFGADVIKVEAPGAPDSLRHWGAEQLPTGRDALWTIYARNKRCITLNLRESEGQAIARELVRQCDVLVENFRPGTLERWHLGPDDLSEVNPDLIMVRVSGFGMTGPYRDKAGFGSVAEAMGGIRHTTGYPDRPPTRTGISLGDSLAALFGTIGALIAICGRERGTVKSDGHVQTVDVAIYEAVFTLMESLIPDFVLFNKVRERTGSILANVAPSNAYPCRDGLSVVIAANADTVFQRLCRAIACEDLITDERFATHQARGQNMEELDSIIADWTRQHDATAVTTAMDAAGVPSGPIYTAREMLEDPHFQARGLIDYVPIEDGERFPMPGVIPKLSKGTGRVRWVGPLEAGSHNEEVYSSLLGLDAEEITSLGERGII